MSPLVDWTWLRDLDQLVMQRVEHQNEGKLVDFSFKLLLSNGRITHITARSDFAGFRDLSNVESVGVELVWTFLVKFPTSRNPEKQEIRFVSKTAELDDHKMGKKGPLHFIDKLAIESEEMTVDIFYSNVTWGEDLMQVISNHVNGWFPHRSLIWQRVATLSVRLSAPVLVILFMISSSLSLDRAFKIRVVSISEQAGKLADLPVSIELLNKKIDVLINNIEKPGILLRVFVPLLITVF
jgi:hypothetical protein